MKRLQPLGIRATEIQSGLSQEGIYEQTAAHSNPAMNAPYRQFYTCALKCLAPCEHVLVNTVDQGAIQIEQERRR